MKGTLYFQYIFYQCIDNVIICMRKGPTRCGRDYCYLVCRLTIVNTKSLVTVEGVIYLFAESVKQDERWWPELRTPYCEYVRDLDNDANIYEKAKGKVIYVCLCHFTIESEAL